MVANNSVAPAQLLTFAYDYKGRRISKTVWNNTTGFGSPATSLGFIYDGWNLIAELNTVSTPALVRSYVWGSDLSGTIQGAGGVGGLLEVSYHGAQTTNCFAAFDGNGNLSTLVSAADATLAAQYEYGPFGEVLRETGTMAKIVPFRFSARYQDEETGLFDYPRRPYDPSQGRFLCKDPFGESGGRNLYALARNTLAVDPFGLVELHYIDHPKWEVLNLDDPNPFIYEFLWAGHYLTFNAADASQLANRGVLMVMQRSVAKITDCKTGATVTPISHYWYFANRFVLNSDGTLPGNGADNREPFTDGQFHMFTQIGNFSMDGMFNRYDGTSGGRFTKGRIHSVMEFHIIPADAFNGEGWDTSPIPGYDDTNINGHELGRPYWGRMADTTPASWTTSLIYNKTVTLDFKWDDCAGCSGGDSRWDFKIDPWLTERGAQRSRYQDRQWSAVDLVLTPSR